MTTCPKCNFQVRTGAKFCPSCGFRMAEEPLGAVSGISSKQDSPLPASPITKKLSDHSYATTRLTQPKARSNTQPLQRPAAFSPRPSGAVFNNYFLVERLVYSAEQENRYIVRQPNETEEQRIRVCPNPACGAVFLPLPDGPMRFCTDCKTALGQDKPSLVLIETPKLLFNKVNEIALLGLAHSTVRPPLLSFTDQVHNSSRYCVVVPETQPLTARPEPSQALLWGQQLAQGLHYLHQNGVFFQGRIHEQIFGLDGNRPVFANFAEAEYQAQGMHLEHPDDVNALSLMVFAWATGKTQPGYDANLPPSLNGLFEQALTPPGFSTGEALAQAIDMAVKEASVVVPVDFRMGRKTNVGKQRNLNEDSLLTLESNRIQQSVGQPLGVYVVADGMGGHAAGEVASALIVNTIAQKAALELFRQQTYAPTDQDRQRWVIEAVDSANSAVFEKRKSAGTDMGSTLVIALMEGTKAFISNVGDSRAYRINARGIQQITTDHSLVQRLIATNQITPAEARHHPQRNVVYRTVGDKPKVEIDINQFNFAIGDRLLLCSDGLSGMVEDHYLQQIVMGASSPQAAVDALIEAANEAGGEDNITAILVELVKG